MSVSRESESSAGLQPYPPYFLCGSRPEHWKTGEIFELNHLVLKPDPDKPVALKVLSTDPRVFDILNIFSEDEADAIVSRALAETSPSHRMHRSTTGTTENAVFYKRTSENAFDTHGATAVAVKK